MKNLSRIFLALVLMTSGAFAQQMGVGTAGSSFNPAIPGPIGLTTPSTGTFTSATVSGAISSTDVSTTVPNTNWVNGELHTGAQTTYGARIYLSGTPGGDAPALLFGAVSTTANGNSSSGQAVLTVASGTGSTNGMLVVDPTTTCIPANTTILSGGGTTSWTLSANLSAQCNTGDIILANVSGSLLGQCQWTSNTSTSTSAAALVAALKTGTAPCNIFGGGLFNAGYGAVATGSSVWLYWPNSLSTVTVGTNAIASGPGLKTTTLNGNALSGQNVVTLTSNAQTTAMINGQWVTDTTTPSCIPANTYIVSGGGTTSVTLSANLAAQCNTGETFTANNTIVNVNAQSNGVNFVGGVPGALNFGSANGAVAGGNPGTAVDPAGVLACTTYLKVTPSTTQINNAQPPNTCGYYFAGGLTNGTYEFDFAHPMNLIDGQTYYLLCGINMNLAALNLTFPPSTVGLNMPTSCSSGQEYQFGYWGNAQVFDNPKTNGTQTAGSYTVTLALDGTSTTSIACTSGSNCSGQNLLTVTTPANFTVSHNIFSNPAVTGCIPAGTSILSKAGSVLTLSQNLAFACNNGETINDMGAIAPGMVVNDTNSACVPANNEVVATSALTTGANTGRLTITMALPLVANCGNNEFFIAYTPVWICTNCSKATRTVYAGLGPTTATGTNNSGQTSLILTSAANFAVGDGVVDLTTPAHITGGTTVSSITGNTLTLSANIATNITAGEFIGVQKKFTFARAYGTTFTRVDVFGCGGSGAGGAVVTPTSSGGGGGGGGGHIWQTFASIDLATTTTIQICAQGTGGAAGAVGLDPIGTTTFGTVLTAYNGGAGALAAVTGAGGGGGAGYTGAGADAVTVSAGAAGTNGGAAGGAAANQGVFNTVTGAGSGGGGGNAATGVGSAAVSAGAGGCVGGAAGGGNLASVAKIGGAGAYPIDNGAGITVPAGGTAGTTGGTGGTATATSANLNGGSGGGGGGSTTGLAGSAGASSGFCAGGSGGGATLSGTAGAGAAGAPGGVVIESW